MSTAFPGPSPDPERTDLGEVRPASDRRMSLGEHLVELRKRLIISIVAIVGMMILAFIFQGPIIAFLTSPVGELARESSIEIKLNWSTPTSPLEFAMRVSFSVGMIVSAPIWIWQLWAYIVPGLTRREKKYTVIFVSAALPLFVGGATVGWLIIPHFIRVMQMLVPEAESSAQLIDARSYYDLVFKLVLAVGIAFVLPLFLVALNLAGVMSGKTILKGWRVAIIVAACFAAITTPATDVVSMMILTAALTLLYLLAAGVALIIDWRRRRRERALLAEATT